MKLESITRTPDKNKAYRAVFRLDSGAKKTVRFGTSSNYVLNPDKTKDDRKNYLKRHRVRENWDNPLTAGSLSRHILWGDSRSLHKNIRDFKRKFKL